MLINAPLSNAPVSTQTRAVLCCLLTLGTHLGVKTYNRTFRRIEAALFLADVLVLLRGRASSAHHAEIAQVNTVMEGEMQRLDRFLTDQERWIDKRFKASDLSKNTLPDQTILYTQPVTLTLTLRTPRARLYADLLARLEKTLEALDRAWYANGLSTVDHLQQGHLLFRNFYRTCGIIERLAWGLGRRVRESDDGLVADLPDYQAMLLKRTRTQPSLAQEDLSELRVTEEANEQMTVEETHYLEVTEALFTALNPEPEDHPFATALEPSVLMENVGQDADPVPDNAPKPSATAVHAVEEAAAWPLETSKDALAAVGDAEPVASAPSGTKRPRLQDAFRRQGAAL